MVGMPRISCLFRGAEPCIIVVMMPTILLTLLIIMLGVLIIMLIMLTINWPPDVNQESRFND